MKRTEYLVYVRSGRYYGSVHSRHETYSDAQAEADLLRMKGRQVKILTETEQCESEVKQNEVANESRREE